MNATELFAPIKTASIEAEQSIAHSAETADVRGLKAGELQLVGGGDIAVGIR